MNKTILILLVILIITIATMFWAQVETSWISAAIALVALIFSLISAFKDEIFPFRPKLLAEEVILTPPTASSHDSLGLVFPLVFINDGNGAGVIEGISIKIEGAGTTKLYTPVSEIDFEIYIRGKRKLHAESMLGSFGAFPLHGKESIQKHILFVQEEASKKYPFSTWEEGSYSFSIYLKHSEKSKTIMSAKFTHIISKDMIDNYNNGAGAVLVGSCELDI